MSEPSLSERVEQQRHLHAQLIQKVYKIERQIKVGLETRMLKQDLKIIKKQITSIQARLHALEKTSLKKDIEEKTRATFLGYAKQAFPLLWGLCGTMLVLGLTLDDLHLVKLILGK